LHSEIIQKDIYQPALPLQKNKNKENDKESYRAKNGRRMVR
jgi:hypothetical protein